MSKISLKKALKMHPHFEVPSCKCDACGEMFYATVVSQDAGGNLHFDSDGCPCEQNSYDCCGSIITDGSWDEDLNILQGLK